MSSRLRAAATISVFTLAATSVGFSVVSAANATSQDAVQTITASTNHRQAIPNNFLGISIEDWDLARYTSAGSAFATALNGLNPYGDDPAGLRIGGGSADQSWWDDGTGTPPRDATYALGQSWLGQLESVESSTDAPLIVTLNMASGNPEVAAQLASHVSSAFPSSNVGFEIGNEPDLYAAQPNAEGVAGDVRPKTYSFNNYVSQLHTYVSAIRSAVPDATLSLADFATSRWITPKTVPTLASSERTGSVGTLDWHYYPLTACGHVPGKPGYPTATSLLSAATLHSEVTTFAKVEADAAASKLPWRATELNSVSCGGASGVSNTFASALWALPTLFNLVDAGASGVNVHINQAASYSPIALSASGVPYVTPLYYGLRLFADATPAGSTLVPTVSSTAGPIQSWATISATGELRYVLMNGSHAPATARLAIPNDSTPQEELMSAPSISSTTGVDLAGQTWDGSTDGGPIGNETTTSTSAANGYAEITLPSDAAAVIDAGPAPAEVTTAPSSSPTSTPLPTEPVKRIATLRPGLAAVVQAHAGSSVTWRWKSNRPSCLGKKPSGSSVVIQCPTSTAGRVRLSAIATDGGRHLGTFVQNVQMVGARRTIHLHLTRAHTRTGWRLHAWAHARGLRVLADLRLQRKRSGSSVWRLAARKLTTGHWTYNVGRQFHGQYRLVLKVASGSGWTQSKTCRRLLF